MLHIVFEGSLIFPKFILEHANPFKLIVFVKLSLISVSLQLILFIDFFPKEFSLLNDSLHEITFQHICIFCFGLKLALSMEGIVLKMSFIDSICILISALALSFSSLELTLISGSIFEDTQTVALSLFGWEIGEDYRLIFFDKSSKVDGIAMMIKFSLIEIIANESKGL